MCLKTLRKIYIVIMYVYRVKEVKTNITSFLRYRLYERKKKHLVKVDIFQIL